ncbi:MAG TPA: Gldg family protein [Burkholderiales bacterium]|nr:Gldg family protein [Burkholderiales bacterium]
MKKRSLELMLYSTGGIIALAIILIATNFLASNFNRRADLTAGHIYTLSPATTKILSQLKAPVTIRYYFSQSSDAVPIQIRTYARRVADVLDEYRRAGNGKVIVQKLNPLPDSDAEDSAQLDGVEGQATPAGDKFYFGLAVSFLDKHTAIPALSPDRERLLEYDITSAISRVTEAHKPVIGVMSAFPVFGSTFNPMTRQPPSQPWVLIDELKSEFTVKDVALDATKIADDVKVLLLVHPRGISEKTEYAIDQFLMRGGRLVAFLDPYAYFDPQRNPMNPYAGGRASRSTLPHLLKAWGIHFNQHQVVDDMTYASGEGDSLLPALLSLNVQALNMNNVVTSQVGTLLLPFAGTFSGKPAAGLKETVLAHTSPNSMLVNSLLATSRGKAAENVFKPSGKEYPLAIELSGKFKTAFPDGLPKKAPEPGKSGDAAKADTDKSGDAAEPAAAATGSSQLKESKTDTSVALIGDADMLTDTASVSIQNVFGQKVVIPRNDNLNFAQGLVEQFAGDQGLIDLRSRASFTRPLKVIEDMQMRAQAKYLGKIKDLEDTLNSTQQKLSHLQKEKPKQGVILTPQERKEVDAFRQKLVDTRKDLKDLRRNLRRETDSLELWTKVINIGAVPLLVALFGIGVALTRRRRAASK